MIHHSIFDLQLTNSSQILNSIISQAEMCAQVNTDQGHHLALREFHIPMVHFVIKIKPARLTLRTGSRNKPRGNIRS